MTDDDDWRLSYYSNEFNAVLVPVDYWQGEQSQSCTDWLDSVHADFRFFVACRASMLAAVSLAALSDALIHLKPQLSALVFLDKKQPASDAISRQFVELADSLEVELLGTLPGPTQRVGAKQIWRPDAPVYGARFALIEDDLSDLRTARVTVEQFADQLEDDLLEATIIVDHPQLQAGNLSRFRSMLEIMGY